jgi:ribonuclease BN (tRNA processing enzyme)
MKLRILGCNGGIGGQKRNTTSMLIDHDILLDAGTGVADLSIPELQAIDHVFLTHAHMDHIACLPFIPDAAGDLRDQPLTVHASEETIEVLKAHVFNGQIWPDFSVIPSKEKPFVRFNKIKLGQTIKLGSRNITPLPAQHTVPAVGYLLESGSGSLVFSGDTTTNDALWEEVNKLKDLRYLIIETAFSDKDEPLAMISKHLSPRLLAEELKKLKLDPKIFITHPKPGQADTILGEVRAKIGQRKVALLRNGQVFDF